MASIISAVAFVPPGHAAAFPSKYNLSDDEYARIQGLSALQLTEAKQALTAAQSGEPVEDDGDEAFEDVEESDKAEEDDEMAKYKLDEYDDEPEGGETMGIFNNIKGLAYHAHGEADPYITLANAPGNDEEDEDDREDLQILPTDNIILAAKTEDDVSHLEVYVYEDDSSNLYVHHDILLPSFPLCLEWINYANPEQGGNRVAIGTFEPDIEIWDLDVLDSLYPVQILGAGSNPTQKRRKKKNDRHHVDAVLALSANPNARNLLLSASADETLKLWDLASGTCAKSYSHHTDKVSAVCWNPIEATVLASGGYDHRTILSDARMPEQITASWDVGSDVEGLAWDPHQSHLLYTATDAGMLICHDTRQVKKSAKASLWRIQAHDGPLSAFTVNRAVPGMIATGGSEDKRIKLWTTADGKPNMLTSRDFDVGKVFSLGFLPASNGGGSMGLVAGGSAGVVRVWDTATNAAVRKAYASHASIAKAAEGDRTVAIADDEDEVSEDDLGEEDAAMVSSDDDDKALEKNADYRGDVMQDD
ncbi:WD40-repeat-containing domain protein [Protomyces lactucae-debilis]|uniref:WD40-repeat-containing domain protein n=1 Tax=Protomyces lactucae-debilis TaxID=2754530 RepID=A0A1Y2FA55_PROLT|nr:WD40-repeat-containing domain protein [Protomyces lactucae-debilis]ORY80788.1 WD40-repeat-containing domain protein [Protomyces lactucae-debilis]